MNERVMSIVMNVTLTSISVYCTHTKEPFYDGGEMNDDYPAVMFVHLFREKYLLAE